MLLKINRKAIGVINMFSSTGPITINVGKPYYVVPNNLTTLGNIGNVGTLAQTSINTAMQSVNAAARAEQLRLERIEDARRDAEIQRKRDADYEADKAKERQAYAAKENWLLVNYPHIYYLQRVRLNGESYLGATGRLIRENGVKAALDKVGDIFYDIKGSIWRLIACTPEHVIRSFIQTGQVQTPLTDKIIDDMFTAIDNHISETSGQMTPAITNYLLTKTSDELLAIQTVLETLLLIDDILNPFYPLRLKP
jgi:hypothetical protein